MTKKLTFKPELATADDAHIAGGCALSEGVQWPLDLAGKPQLHLITIPMNWIVEKSPGWISIFTPYNLDDTFLHWENLTPDEKNISSVIFHANDGKYRNEYSKELSTAKVILLDEDSALDSPTNFCSKIYGVPAWLQDVDVMQGYQSVLAFTGDDVDIGFPEEIGIFSDGIVYVFLKDGFQYCANPSVQGFITFQFT